MYRVSYCFVSVGVFHFININSECEKWRHKRNVFREGASPIECFGKCVRMRQKHMKTAMPKTMEKRRKETTTHNPKMKWQFIMKGTLFTIYWMGYGSTHKKYTLNSEYKRTLPKQSGSNYRTKKYICSMCTKVHKRIFDKFFAT